VVPALGLAPSHLAHLAPALDLQQLLAHWDLGQAPGLAYWELLLLLAHWHLGQAQGLAL
jgi:hypothetical protein